MAYQNQVSSWQVHFSFQCYVDMAKLIQKFGSMSPIVNCNPGREQITCRKLFLRRLQRVLGTVATSSCQQTRDSLSESKPQIKLKRTEIFSAVDGPVHASLLIQNCPNCSYRMTTQIPPKLQRTRWTNQKVIVSFITTEQFSGNCFIYYHWTILWYAYPGFFQSKVGLFGPYWETEYFWSFWSSKIISKHQCQMSTGKKNPPELYLSV